MLRQRSSRVIILVLLLLGGAVLAWAALAGADRNTLLMLAAIDMIFVFAVIVGELIGDVAYWLIDSVWPWLKKRMDW